MKSKPQLIVALDVDTFEEDEPVDLESISKELNELNDKVLKIDDEILRYCKELGINTPF